MLRNQIPNILFLLLTILFTNNLLSEELVDDLQVAMSKLQVASNEVKDMVGGLLTHLIKAMKVEKGSIVQGDSKKITIDIKTDHQVKGQVARKSRFPYDFNLVPKDGRVIFELNVEDEKVALNLNGHLQCTIIDQKDIDDMVKKVVGWKPWMLPLIAVVKKVFIKTQSDPLIILDEMTFYYDNSDEKKIVRVKGKRRTPEDQEHKERIESSAEEDSRLLYDHLKYEKYARSAMAFGCMMRANPEDPLAPIPWADAFYIVKLLAKQQGNGMGDDGRTAWSMP